MRALKLSTIIITTFVVAVFSGCGDNKDSELHTQLINGFGTELRESLPEVTPAAEKGSPSDAAAETYASAQTYGGLFQRMLGDDPLSIFFTVDITDQLIGELLYAENPDMRFGGSRALTLPFFGGDSITFDETFIYDGTHTSSILLTFEDQSAAMPITIDDFRGGYSDDSIAISYHVDVPDFADATYIYFAERDSEGKLFIKYAHYGTEFHEEGDPTYTTYNSRNVYFLRDIANDLYTYKSAGKTIREDNDDESVFSIIMGGVTEKFIIRRRAYFNDVDPNPDRFIDQFFATTYDPETDHVASEPIEENYSDNPFDITGGGFTDVNGGLGDVINITDPDFTDYADIVAAQLMFDFSEPDDLPTESNVTPATGWPF